MDVPQNGVQIAQHGSCANALTATSTGGTSGDVDDCSNNYEKYGMIITSQTDQGLATSGPAGSGTAGANLYQTPYTGGTSGKGTMVPTQIPLNQPGTSCTTATAVTASTCPNNAATFGSVTGTIGSSRVITMDLHFVF